MNPEDLLIGEGESVTTTIKSFLGIQREAHVCERCNVACEPTMTYDRRRCAFDGGKSPAWYCDECDTYYRREARDGDHTLDLYGRE